MPAITIMFGEMTPIDTFEENEEGAICPRPTQDPELNEENKSTAVDVANYRDPADDGGFGTDEVCGNCAAYNQREDILDCIGDESGDVGFCQKLKFVCSAEFVCDKWATGGPITSDIEDDYNENL